MKYIKLFEQIIDDEEYDYQINMNVIKIPYDNELLDFLNMDFGNGLIKLDNDIKKIYIGYMDLEQWKHECYISYTEDEYYYMIDMSRYLPEPYGEKGNKNTYFKFDQTFELIEYFTKEFEKNEIL